MKPFPPSFSSPTCCLAVTPTEFIRYIDMLALHVEHRSLRESYSLYKASLFLGFVVGWEEFLKGNHLPVDFNLGFLFKRQDFENDTSVNLTKLVIHKFLPISCTDQ